MKKQYDVVALGEALVEFNQTDPGGQTYRQGFGGDTSNVAIAASRQGARAAYLTQVGDDKFGAMLRELWDKEKVDTSGVGIDAQAPTGVYFVSHGPGGHEFSYLRSDSAASRMTPQNLSCEVIRDANWLHVSAISQAISATACDAVFAAIDVARAAGISISFDPNLRLRLWPIQRAKAIINATIGMVDLFLPSLDEARPLAGVDDVNGIFAWCFRQGAHAVVLKCGREGAWHAQDGSLPQLAPGIQVEALDATGAGDCFDGSLLARLAAGDSLAEAVRYANVSAALSTLGYGAVAPIPYAVDVLPRLADCTFSAA